MGTGAGVGGELTRGLVTSAKKAFVLVCCPKLMGGNAVSYTHLQP